jgi:hypothetical protein
MQSVAAQIQREQSIAEVEDRIASMEEIFRLQGAEELEAAEVRYFGARQNETRAIVLAASRGEGFASPEHRSAPSNGPKRPWPSNNSAPRPAGKPTGPRTGKPKSDGVPGNGYQPPKRGRASS